MADLEHIKKRLKFLEGLNNLKASEVPRKEGYVDPLLNEVNVVKSAPIPETKTVIKGVTETLENPKAAQKLLTGNQFTDKIANLRALKQLAKTGGQGLKSVVGAIPYVGGALLSGDHSFIESIEAQIQVLREQL